MTKIQARQVLWWLVFVGFAVNYMIRINLNITIVDMVQQSQKRASLTGDSACAIEKEREVNLTAISINHTSQERSFQDSSFIYANQSSFMKYEKKPTNEREPKKIRSLEKSVFDALNIKYEDKGFHWNEYQQGLVLGSFFWIHWVTQIPGGILAKKYGTKLVFGLSNVIGCWMCFLIPVISYWDYKMLICYRVIQGLISGLAWPAMHHMTGQWIPPNERSKFVTAYLGSSIGIAAFYPLFGFIMSWLSWEYVFHFCGLFGSIWFVGWALFVYDTPAQHPNISDKERNYIEKSLGASIQYTKAATPWKSILKSKDVWMNVIAQFGGIWGLFTLMTQAPTYFKVIHGWNITMTGILSGLPHLLRFIFALFFSTFADYLLRTCKMSRTNVRKFATTMCTIVKGVFVLFLAYSGCNSIAAVLFLTLATCVHGAVSTGPLASVVDLSPNYAGIVLGLSGMIGVLPGFISPAIVGALTLGNSTTTSWKYVFLISAAMLIISGILYDLFAESNVLSWNNPQMPASDKEMQMLNEKRNDNEINKTGSLDFNERVINADDQESSGLTNQQ